MTDCTHSTPPLPTTPPPHTHTSKHAGLADGLRASIEPLVSGSALPTLLLTACAEQSSDVRQSAFALLGDLAKACPR
jgi:hypothetical protein